jgi:hypothetical protein
LSVLTGIAPQELLALDAEMYGAMVDAARERWTQELELQAVGVELAHAHLLAFLRVHTKKHTRLPDPLRVERPGQPVAGTSAKTPEPVSIAALAELAGEGVTRQEAGS